jgi:hypothetical protein
VRAYAGGGLTDWFLPSKDELNAMCNYSRNPTAPAAPSVSCYGSAGSTQDATFAAGAYGFAIDFYWSSSQDIANDAWLQDFVDGAQDYLVSKGDATVQFRPVRAF